MEWLLVLFYLHSRKLDQEMERVSQEIELASKIACISNSVSFPHGSVSINWHHML